jgi:hypothetical protein
MKVFKILIHKILLSINVVVNIFVFTKLGFNVSLHDDTAQIFRFKALIQKQICSGQNLTS